MCALLLVAAAEAPGVPANSGNAPAPWSDAEIRELLRQWVDGRHLALGMVVGVITPEGPRTIAYGRLSREGNAAPDGNTEFEIGSVTKVFTGLLLAQMAQTGQVKLGDPVAKYLPRDVTVPSRGGKEITIEDLATQRSGLPWWPPRQPYADPRNPWARYSVRQLDNALARTRLERDPGAAYGYSNFAFGVLGQVLVSKAGMPYADLLKRRITDPLGMESTAIALTPAMEQRLAAGYSARLRPAEYWQTGAMDAAGGLHSTAHDLLLFLSAELGLTRTPLASAMGFQVHAVRRPTDTAAMEIALAWRITHTAERELVWHTGGTGGFASFVGFAPDTRRGVVVLSNAANDLSGLGLHLLDRTMPLGK